MASTAVEILGAKHKRRSWKVPKGVVVEDCGVYQIPTTLIVPLEGQPREYFDPELMKALQSSINEVGQRDPALVRTLNHGSPHPFGLINGERRFRACRELGLPLRALVETYPSDDDAFIASSIANFNSAPHDALETARALLKILKMERIQKLKQGERVPTLARMFGHSEMWVRQHLSLLRLPEDYQRLYKGDVPKNSRASVHVGSRLAGLPKETQRKLIDTITRRGLKAKHANRLIDRTINESGLDRTRRGRRPSDDWDLLKAYVNRTGEDMAPHLDLLADGKLGDIVRSRGVLEIKEMANDIQNLIGRLKAIHDVVYGECGRLSG